MLFTFAAAALTVSGNLGGMLDAYLTRIFERHQNLRAAEIAALKTPADVRARQVHVRAKILDAIGGFPEKTPLNARVTGTLDRDGYRIEKVIYESLPGFKVTANLYLPSGAGPFPAILGVAGHSNEGKAIDTYQRAWIGFVKRGWVVLAFDPPGQGERSEYWDPAAGKSAVGIGTREHTMAGLQCLLTGTSIARYEAWDGIRGFDYLLTRTEVDPARIAVAGNSGGGTQSAYLAALEPRLSAAAPSCYLTSWAKQWFAPGPQDAEQNFHGFLSNNLDFPDFLIAFGPKPVKMMTAIRDFFPIEGARATFKEAAAVFEILGARDKIDFFEYDDTHGWSKPRREATYRWFERWLNNRTDDGLEPEFAVEKPETLNVTVTGQLATSVGSETVSSLNRKLAEDMHPARAAAKGGDLRALVERRLNVDWPRFPVSGKKVGEVGRDGYRIERIELTTEPGITVPALLFVPAKTPERMDAVIWLDPAGKSAAEPAIAKRVLAGQAVLAIDPRGWGESGPGDGRRGGYTPNYQTFMRAFLLGRTMMGLQVVDVAAAHKYLVSRGAAAVSVYGKGNGGVLAIYAGVLEPGLHRVETEGSLESYLWLARQKVHEGTLDVIVPGVLHDFDLPDLVKHLGDRYAR